MKFHVAQRYTSLLTFTFKFTHFEIKSFSQITWPNTGLSSDPNVCLFWLLGLQPNMILVIDFGEFGTNTTVKSSSAFFNVIWLGHRLDVHKYTWHTYIV